MCIGGTPNVPTVPERQTARAPNKADSAPSGDAARRRMAYAASILTSPEGTMGGPNTTTGMKSVTGV